MRFVLVHGAFHGAWCWDRVIPEFESRGHSVVTVDLPGSGSRVSEVADLGGYRDAVVDHLESGDVLVGHSFGSLAISLAADAVPEEIAYLVYLNAKLPIEGRTMAAATPIDALFSGSVLRVASAVLRLLPDGIAPVELWSSLTAVAPSGSSLNGPRPNASSMTAAQRSGGGPSGS